MISIPLYIFLFIYLGVLLLAGILFIINMYHLIATASFTSASGLATLLFSLALALTIGATFDLLSGTDWRLHFTIPPQGSFSPAIERDPPPWRGGNSFDNP